MSTTISESPTQRAGVRLTIKKGTSKIPSKSIIHIPIDMFYGKKKISAIESATVIFFLKFFHNKLVETTLCGAILTPVMGFYGS